MDNLQGPKVPGDYLFVQDQVSERVPNLLFRRSFCEVNNVGRAGCIRKICRRLTNRLVIREQESISWSNG
jgi:hypothetical protein